jgi:hypothetical protein
VLSAQHVSKVVVILVAGALAWSVGCGSNNGGMNTQGVTGSSSGGSGGSGSGGNGGGNGGLVLPDAGNTHCTSSGGCVVICPDATKHTTISGTVWDPAGNNPIPGVAVYVPQNVPLPDLPQGAACGDCSSLYKGTVLASDITKSDGTFQIVDAPGLAGGGTVPLVVQAGKWRAVYSVNVINCQDNKPSQMLKLPSSMASTPSAWLPDIAISTGGLDSLECLLRRIGVDASEYTSGPGGSGHIHIFQGGVGGAGVAGPQSPGGSPQSYSALWNSAASLQKYDVVLLSCEGGETEAPNASALSQYVQMYGGRVFASHFHYAWFTAPGSPFQNLNFGQFNAGSNDTGNINAVIDTGFAQGQALHDWLKLPQINVLGMGGAPADQLALQQSRQNVASLNIPPATSWIEAANPPGDSRATPGLSEYFSFDLKMGELTCGRVVYSDLHVGAASGDYGDALNTSGATTSGVVPDQCKQGKLSPQEAPLEYMLFNISSCLAPPTMKPPAPTVAR